MSGNEGDNGVRVCVCLHVDTDLGSDYKRVTWEKYL